MASSDSAAAVAELLDLAKQITLGRYFAGVALTLAIYDWIIVLPQEIRWVWGTGWRWTKTVYYINRFLSLVGLTITVIETTDQWETPLSVKFCKVYFWLVGMIQWGTFFSGNTILTLRIVALYNNRPVVTRLLYALLLTTWSITFAFTADTLYRLSSETYYSMDFHLCASTASAPLSAAIFVTPAIFELILFVMTFIRAIQDVRLRIADNLLTPASPLLAVLYRDGFYYFASVFAVYVWIAMAYLTTQIKSTYMGVYFGWAIVIVMSCRVYLNLAEAVHKRTIGMTGEDTTDFITSPTIAFRSKSTNPRSESTFNTLEFGLQPSQHIELMSKPPPIMILSSLEPRRSSLASQSPL